MTIIDTEAPHVSLVDFIRDGGNPYDVLRSDLVIDVAKEMCQARETLDPAGHAEIMRDWQSHFEDVDDDYSPEVLRFFRWQAEAGVVWSEQTPDSDKLFDAYTDRLTEADQALVRRWWDAYSLASWQQAVRLRLERIEAALVSAGLLDELPHNIHMASLDSDPVIWD